MPLFCGQDNCSIDANGRVKFSPRFIRDFSDRCDGNIVLHCLPEGAVAVYPEDVYERMRGADPRRAEKAGASALHRRELRRFGALSQQDTISAQGRVTIPNAYRAYAGLSPGSEAVVVGVEIGVEVWNAERWAAELSDINHHLREKSEREMAADLNNTATDMRTG